MGPDLSDKAARLCAAIEDGYPFKLIFENRNTLTLHEIRGATMFVVEGNTPSGTWQYMSDDDYDIVSLADIIEVVTGKGETVRL